MAEDEARGPLTEERKALELAGIDPDVALPVVEEAVSVTAKLNKLGIGIFGWSGTGLLVVPTKAGPAVIVAELACHCDGGDPDQMTIDGVEHIVTKD